MEWFVLAVATVLVALAAVILIRTVRFKPVCSHSGNVAEESFDKDAAVAALGELVKCRTVSSYCREDEDEAEFERLVDMLPSLYPHVFENCTVNKIDDRALLIHWRGKTETEPAVLMAHYDVVPAHEDAWEKPPFDAVIEDGVMWGRGTLDTKVTVNGILSAAEKLISEGFVPRSDVYFAFSGGEEVSGKGAVRIVDYFKERNITLGVVVDEGGAVVENVFPGVKQPCALIGIAEKGLLDLRYKVQSEGGHASSPAPHTPVGVLSRACTRVEAKPFKLHVTKPVAEMFDTLGRHSTFVYRMIFANMWCFGWVLDLIAKKSGGEMNALMRTTVAFTQMRGSEAANVIPPVASMVSNIRINPEDSIESVVEYIRKTIGDDSVCLEVVDGMQPSRISSTDCDGWRKVCRAVSETWQGSVVAPYLMVQCSDSRHYGEISDRVYRFSAMALTSEERATIHGNNERIRLDAIGKAVEFYIRLMRQL